MGLNAVLDAVASALCAAFPTTAVPGDALGHCANLAFLALLLEPLRTPHLRQAASLQVIAALAPLARVAASLRHWATRRTVPRLEPAPGDLCPICHECFDDDGPEDERAHCRWGCGRAVHADCIALWKQRSDSCVLCGAKWS